MKMNRLDEAKKIMEEAIPMGSMLDVHFYGRELLRMKQTDEAIKVYKKNFEKYPNQFTTNVGLGRAYSAKGDYKKALTYMKTALPQSPDEGNKFHVEGMIKKLQENQDVN
jgi:tetratricopeptide (TPR) repeat protein